MYLKGRYSLHAVDFLKALTSFEAAIVRDPDYAQAHAGLADVYCSLGFYGFIPSLVSLQRAGRRPSRHRAGRFPPGNSRITGQVGTLLWLGLPVFEGELRRAISLNPKNPISHVWLGLGLALQRRLEEVKAEVALAFELEPIGPGGWVLAVIHMCTGQIALAIETCQRILGVTDLRAGALGQWACLHG